jgi:hypothetical protein
MAQNSIVTNHLVEAPVGVTIGPSTGTTETRSQCDFNKKEVQRKGPHPDERFSTDLFNGS